MSENKISKWIRNLPGFDHDEHPDTKDVREFNAPWILVCLFYASCVHLFLLMFTTQEQRVLALSLLLYVFYTLYHDKTTSPMVRSFATAMIYSSITLLGKEIAEYFNMFNKLSPYVQNAIRYPPNLGAGVGSPPEFGQSRVIEFLYNTIVISLMNILRPFLVFYPYVLWVDLGLVLYSTPEKNSLDFAIASIVWIGCYFFYIEVLLTSLTFTTTNFHYLNEIWKCLIVLGMLKLRQGLSKRHNTKIDFPTDNETINKIQSLPLNQYFMIITLLISTTKIFFPSFLLLQHLLVAMNIIVCIPLMLQQSYSIVQKATRCYNGALEPNQFPEIFD